ncbi:MAG TPA: alpha/beta hydrolase, partial [Solirubrobacteraceae bacterium]
QDPLIPVEHATVAHRGLPNSRLEVFEDAGHFPQLHDPVRFALTLIDFIDSTEPTQMEFTDSDFDKMRKLLLDGRG